MFQNISLGVYYPGNSVLHRLQARTKLLLLLGFMICLAVANQREWHFAPYIGAVALTLVGTALGGVSLRLLWRRMRLLVLLALLGAPLTVLFPDSGNGRTFATLGPWPVGTASLWWLILGVILVLAAGILLIVGWKLALRRRAASATLAARAFGGRHRAAWRTRILVLLVLLELIALIAFWLVGTIATPTVPIGPIAISYDGVWLLLSFSTVLLILYALSLIVTMTTTPVALIEGITRLLAPLRWLRLPVDDFALMLLLALRFIPTLIEELEQLLKAQSARGADMAHGTIRERLASLVALFVPLVQGVLRRASDLATALEARGYEVEGKQTLLHEQALGAHDYLVLGVVVLVMVGALLL